MRKIIVEIEVLNLSLKDKTRIRVTPMLTPLEGRVLFGKPKTYVFGKLPTSGGNKYIELPTKPNETVGYKFEFERGNELWDEKFIWLDEGGDILLSDLIISGGTATDSVKSYIDAKFLTVLNLALTGLSLASSAAITAGDTILTAFGKLQKQISNLATAAAEIVADVLDLQSDVGDIFDELDDKQDALGFTPENSANKAADFSVLDNTKYPTTQAADARANAARDAAISILRGSVPAAGDTLAKLDTRLTAQEAIVGGTIPDGDSVANTVTELLAVFQNFSESVNLLNALNGKQDALVSEVNIKTINGQSVLGAGNLTVAASAAWGAITGTLSEQTDLANALAGKANLTGATFSGQIVSSRASNQLVFNNAGNTLTFDWSSLLLTVSGGNYRFDGALALNGTPSSYYAFEVFRAGGQGAAGLFSTAKSKLYLAEANLGVAIDLQGTGDVFASFTGGDFYAEYCRLRANAEGNFEIELRQSRKLDIAGTLRLKDGTLKDVKFDTAAGGKKFLYVDA